jgi:aconitase B
LSLLVKESHYPNFGTAHSRRVMPGYSLCMAIANKDGAAICKWLGPGCIL